MYRAVLVTKGPGDTHPRILFPHDERQLKKDEKLMFKSSTKAEFEEKLKAFNRILIQIDIDVKNYKV